MKLYEIYLTEEQLEEINLKQMGAGALALGSLMGTPKAGSSDMQIDMPDNLKNPAIYQDMTSKIPKIPEVLKYPIEVSKAAQKWVTAIPNKIFNKVTGLRTIDQFLKDIINLPEFNMYVDTVLLNNMEPITNDTIKPNVDNLVRDQIAFEFKWRGYKVKRAEGQSTEFQKWTKQNDYVVRSAKPGQDIVTYIKWKGTMDNPGNPLQRLTQQGSLWATFGVSTIVIPWDQPYESAKIKIKDKYDWDSYYQMTPEEVKRMAGNLFHNFMTGDVNGIYSRGFALAEHFAVSRMPDARSAQMLAKQYAKYGIKVDSKDLQKYRIVELEYNVSELMPKETWIQMQSEINQSLESN